MHACMHACMALVLLLVVSDTRIIIISAAAAAVVVLRRLPNPPPVAIHKYELCFQLKKYYSRNFSAGESHWCRPVGRSVRRKLVSWFSSFRTRLAFARARVFIVPVHACMHAWQSYPLPAGSWTELECSFFRSFVRWFVVNQFLGNTSLAMPIFLFHQRNEILMFYIFNSFH